MCPMLGKKKEIGFGYAWKGLQIAWREEHNFRIHISITIAVILVGIALRLMPLEWLFICIAIGMVLTAELLNTSLEELCDMHKTEHDPHIAKIKDLAAAAVFVSSCVACILGCIIFIPHLILLL